MDLRKDPILREYEAWLDEALRPVREMRARSVAKREAAERAARKAKKSKPGASAVRKSNRKVKPVSPSAAPRSRKSPGSSRH